MKVFITSLACVLTTVSSLRAQIVQGSLSGTPKVPGTENAYLTQTFVQTASLLPYIPESSGIVMSDGFIWSHNDSGNSNTFFKVDPTTGDVIQRISLLNFPNTDWEDITADDNYIYLGDFGNNNGTRTDLKILRVPKSSFYGNTDQLVYVNAEAINISYSDQTSFTSSSSNNFDCEALFAKDDVLYLFTKDRGDSKTRVYKVSKTPGTYVLSPYTAYFVDGLVTGADYNPNTNQVILVGYQSSHKNSFVFYLDSFTDDLFFSGNIRRVVIGNSVNDWQTEGIAFGANSDIYVSCENSYVTASLFLSDESAVGSAGLSKPNVDLKSVRLFPNPMISDCRIESDEVIRSIEICSLDGKLLYRTQPDSKQFMLSKSDINNFHGVCMVCVETENGLSYHRLVLDSNNN